MVSIKREKTNKPRVYIGLFIFGASLRMSFSALLLRFLKLCSQVASELSRVRGGVELA